MGRKRDRRRPAKRDRVSKGSGRRRAVPRGLGLALGVIAMLMGLVFAAAQVRECRNEASFRVDSPPRSSN